MIDLWNSQVKAGDLVWHLGDFCFSRDVNEIEDILRKLNGVKHFIKGNHDDRKILTELKKRNAISWWGDYKEIKLGKQTAVLFHFPMAVWHKQHYGSLHLHGHSHGNYWVSQGKVLDVGLDNTYTNWSGKHKFFTEDDIITYMNERKIAVLDHHQQRQGEM